MGAVVIAGVMVATIAVATPAIADTTYPTWGDVEHAQQNVATKKAEITKLNGLIGQLQATSAAAGKVALQAGEEYQIALDALDSATSRAKTLSAQATSAKKRAASSKRKAGQLAAQLARTGGSNLSLTLFLDGTKATQLLDGLGAMSKLSESSSRVFNEARVQANTAKALSAQAKVAQKARATKSADAASALSQAKAAAESAQAAVDAQNKQQSIMTSQLASLEGASASQLAGYYAGVAWEKAQAAVKTPPKDGTVTGPLPGLPNSAQAAGAIQFAEAQLGEAYVLNGAGPNVWDCSGLTMMSYRSVGVYIGTHSATNQFTTLRGENRLVPLSDRQPGDLLWYSDGGSVSATKYHVTIYIGDGKMIEAPYPGSVVRIAAVRFGDLVPYAGRVTG